MEKVILEISHSVALSEIRNIKWPQIVLCADNHHAKTKFYTGLSTNHIFTVLFDFLHRFVSRQTKLSLILLVLRLNLQSEDLAYRFGVSPPGADTGFYEGGFFYHSVRACAREIFLPTTPIFVSHTHVYARTQTKHNTSQLQKVNRKERRVRPFFWDFGWRIQ